MLPSDIIKFRQVLSLKMEKSDTSSRKSTAFQAFDILSDGTPEFLENIHFTFRLRSQDQREELVPLILSINDPNAKAKSISVVSSGRSVIDHIPEGHVKSLVDAALDLLENANLAVDAFKDLSQAMDFFCRTMDIQQQQRLTRLRNRRRDVGYLLRNGPIGSKLS